MTDALDWPARQGEEAIRQLDMLRHTLGERVKVQRQALAVAMTVADTACAAAKVAAYQDVLALLGPEPAWTVDPDTKEPF